MPLRRPEISSDVEDESDDDGEEEPPREKNVIRPIFNMTTDVSFFLNLLPIIFVFFLSLLCPNDLLESSTTRPAVEENTASERNPIMSYILKSSVHLF